MNYLSYKRKTTVNIKLICIKIIKIRDLDDQRMYLLLKEIEKLFKLYVKIKSGKLLNHGKTLKK